MCNNQECNSLDLLLLKKVNCKVCCSSKLWFLLTSYLQSKTRNYLSQDKSNRGRLVNNSRQVSKLANQLKWYQCNSSLLRHNKDLLGKSQDTNLLQISLQLLAKASKQGNLVKFCKLGKPNLDKNKINKDKHKPVQQL